MIVEIMNIGTELLLGEIVNTNATVIQKVCKDLGIDVYFQSVVGDNEERILNAMYEAKKRGSTCIITTGGLGPTKDDLTKELSAKFLGLELVFNEEEAKKVHDKCKFLSPDKEVASSNYKQAYYPKDCIIIENDIGTANGCVMFNKDMQIINLPGPPKELNFCIEHFLKDYLKQYAKDTLYTKDIQMMGIGESRMAVELNDLVMSQESVTIALYAHEDFNRVRLGVKAKSLEEANEMMKDVENEIRNRMKEYIIDYDYMVKQVLNTIEPFNIYIEDFTMDVSIFECKNFLGITNNPDDRSICIYRTHMKLGDVVKVTYKNYSFSINLLYDASLSIKKLEASIINYLYRWIILNK